MADRTAKLTLALELLNQGKVAEGMAVIRKEIDAGGEAAKRTANALSGTAAAAGEVAAAEGEAAGATAKLAGALSVAGDTATGAGEKQAQAALQGAEAAEGVTASVQGQAAATRAAGEAAVDSGEDAQRAAKETGSAVDKLTQDWKEEIQAAKAAGVAFDEATAAAAIEKLSSMIRASGDSLENQKAALEGLAAGIVEDYGDVGDAAEGAGKEQTEQGKLIGTVLASVRAKISEVDAGMRGVGEAGKAGGDEVRATFLSVDDALKLLNASVDDATQKLIETGILPKSALAELPKLIETVNIAMEQTAGTSSAASAAQVQNLEAVRGKLDELNAVANRQTNAAKDNTGALQEQGNQVNALTGALSGLLNVTGSGSTVFGTMVAKIGEGASAFERTKSAVKTLDLNTLSATKSMAALGAQAALFVAAAVAGAAAGSKFASVNRENADVVDGYTERLKKWIAVDFKDEIDGVNLALQGSGTAFQTYLAWLTLGAARNFEDGSAIRFRIAAVRDGITAMEAEAITAKAGAKAWEFYETTRLAGAKGQELWAQALRESEGDGKKFLAFIKAHNSELQIARSITGQATEANNERKKSTLDLQIALRDLDITMRSEATAERAALLTRTAAAAAEAAGKIQGMTAVDRDRLAIIGEILARGSDMTKDQERIAEGLIAQARAGKAASESVNTLIRLYLQFDIATDGTTKKLASMEKVLSVLTEGWNTNADTVRQRTAQAAADMQSALDATDQLTEAQRAHFQAEIDWLNAVEAERERIESFAAARTGRFAVDTEQAENRVRAAIQARLTDLRSYIPLSDTYAAAIQATSAELADLAANTTGLGSVEKERLDLIVELSAKGSEMNAVEREIVTQLLAEAEAGAATSKALNDLAAAKVALAAATEGITTATNGSTLAINLNIQKILEMIPAGEQHAVILDKLAAALRSQLAATDGITNAQRDRIAQIATLAENSEKLTVSEKRYAEALIATVQAGNHLKVSYTDIIAEEQKRTASIHEQIEALQQQIELMERAQGVTEDQTAINLDQGASVDYLRQKQAALQRELGDGLTVWNASNEVQKQEADLAVERLARMHEEAMSREKSRSSQTALNVALQDGKVAITNLTDASVANVQATIKLGESHGTLSERSKTAADRMRELQGTIPDVSVVMDGLRNKTDDLSAALDKAIGKLEELDKKAGAVASGAQPALSGGFGR